MKGDDEARDAFEGHVLALIAGGPKTAEALTKSLPRALRAYRSAKDARRMVTLTCARLRRRGLARFDPDAGWVLSIKGARDLLGRAPRGAA